ncbi:MAG TPA: mechanosensitive ion channel domain-containing protein [Polyangiaceae bacterium]|jgi:small-conductance mechanosensitive channel
MPTLDQLLAIAHRPLVTLAGGPITIASLFTGFAIVFLAYVIAGLAGRAVRRVLDRPDVARGARFAIAKILQYLIILLGFTVALTSIGVRLDALLAASTVVLVGLGFGLQNIAQNFVSGLILLFERPVARGDFVRIGDTLGEVGDIGMRATRIVTRDEVTIIVPNSELVTARVINHSVPTPNLRIAVGVGVAYGTDLERLQKVLLELAAQDTELLREPAPEVRFDAFGESSLNFSLLVWIGNPREDLRVASRLRFAIEAAFRSAEIEIPFPQLGLHVRSRPRRSDAVAGDAASSS